MEPISLKELQDITLELLLEFDELCQKHNIKYALCGGSLLGAVRHQGFIPWDDDADLMMLREDYEKLLSIIDTIQFKEGRKIVSLKDKSFARNFARYVRTDYHKNEEGFEESDCPWVGIDIFPVDYVPEDDVLFQKQVKRLAFLRNLLMISVTVSNSGTSLSKKLVKNILRPFAKMIGSFRLAEMMDKECQKYSNGDRKYVAGISGMYGIRERWEKKQYDPVTTLTFEGHQLPAPENYDIYLSNLYQDYMEIPPEDKRKYSHTIVYKNK